MRFTRLERLGWNDELARQFEEHAAGFVPGRVSVQHRGSWMVATEAGDALVGITGGLHHQAEPGDLPVVGDWVWLRDGLIDGVLPRSSKFSRKTPWTEVSEQVLVANVEVAFLVMGLDERDFNVRRLERYLTTAWEGGAEPVIVLNKADLATDLEAQVAETESVAFGVPVHAVSAETGDGRRGPASQSPRAETGLRPCSDHRASASPRSSTASSAKSASGSRMSAPTVEAGIRRPTVSWSRSRAAA